MHIHSIKLPLVELKNINVVFEQKKALQNINLTLYPNSIITIVGPNGGGKSTLLKVLLKLLPLLRDKLFIIKTYVLVTCRKKFT